MRTILKLPLLTTELGVMTAVAKGFSPAPLAPAVRFIESFNRLAYPYNKAEPLSLPRGAQVVTTRAIDQATRFSIPQVALDALAGLLGGLPYPKGPSIHALSIERASRLTTRLREVW
jgi:hypothetical protein